MITAMVTRFIRTFRQWLRDHLWAAFLLYHLFLFALTIAFLSSVRWLTGRSIHLGQDPIGVADGIAVALLSGAVIYLTARYYRLVKGPDAAELGIGFSLRRSLELAVGFIVGGFYFAAPLWVSLWRGTARVTDRIDAHFDTATMLAVLGAAVVLLLLQSAMEETTSRAFPMRLWEHRSLLFRLFLPALFFVLVHMISETFEFERASILLIVGVVQGLAYVLTGNIWFATGLHWGANVGAYSMSGLWHAGAVVNVAGPPLVPVWAMGLIMILLLSGAFLIKERRSDATE